MDSETEIATVGGGCFWCTEAVLELIDGVSKVESGYCGGQTDNPTYREVCSGTTGHAEVVRVTFDPAKIGYRDLLVAFMVTHDPTTLNRQGADAGTQYRSVIFTHSDEQKKIANEVIADLTNRKLVDRPIVTQVVPIEKFYKAEDYHQEYYRSNSGQPYCAAVIAPKVAKFRSAFLPKLAKN